MRFVSAVRTGDLPKFNEVLAKFGPKFQSENTYTLIIRLRHNVIKTGVRMISLSYSRISLADIAQKLTLDSSEDAEFIVAKVSCCEWWRWWWLILLSLSLSLKRTYKYRSTFNLQVWESLARSLGRKYLAWRRGFPRKFASCCLCHNK